VDKEVIHGRVGPTPVARPCGWKFTERARHLQEHLRLERKRAAAKCKSINMIDKYQKFHF